MSDEGTRSSEGLEPEKTQIASKRIQVRMPSGKIYGPYQRFEILSFITAKRIKGEEWILVDGTSEWKPIASDPEFFDAIQEVQFGLTKSGKASVPDLPTRGRGFRESAPTKAGAPVPAKAPAPSAARSTPVSGDVEIKVPNAPEALPLDELPQSIAAPSTAAGGITPPPVSTKAASAKRPKPLLLGLVAIAGVVVYLGLSKDGGNGDKTSSSTGLAVTFPAATAYSRPLALVLEDLKAPVPGMPEKITPSQEWGLPETLGAHRWVEDIVALGEDQNIEFHSTAAYWGRWAWDLLWLGHTVAAFDSSAGRHFAREGEKILDALKDRKLVSAPMQALFDSIVPFTEGKWDEVVTKLTPHTDFELAQALAEEAAWWSFWEKGASTGKILVLKDGYSSSDLDAASRMRSALANRDRDFPDYAEQLALRDPRSALLWFASGEFYWRLAMDQVQRANGRFVMGLSTLALYPLSVQVVYWKQYADFLSAFGRQATAELANANIETLKSGKVGKPLKWWDLNQEGLDLARISSEILARSSQGPLFETDIAGLQALGPVIPNGEEALVAAGNHLALEEEWTRAAALFSTAAKVNPKSLSALGGLVWSYASQYRFEKAFEVYDRLSKIPSELPEATKYHSLIELYGREYDEALEGLNQYLKVAPTDPWGHYFSAILWLKQEKNVNCAKSASLARLQANGEIRFRSNLLYLHCRILAKISVSEALSELKTLYAKNPRNIPVVLALTDAFLSLNLTEEAQQVAEDTLRKFPRSYRLRIRMGEINEKKLDYDKAVAFYSSAMKERSDSAEAGIRIAKVYELQEKPLDAARNYYTAGQMNPDYPEIWLMAARAYAAAGQDKEAADLYNKEIDQRPAVMSSFVEAAEFMLSHGAPQRVPEIFQRYKSNLEDDPRVLTRLSQAYLVLKQFDNARTAASTAIARDPKVPEPYRVLAVVLEQQGLYEQSKQNYEKFLTLNPSAPEAEQLRRRLTGPPFTH